MNAPNPVKEVPSFPALRIQRRTVIPKIPELSAELIPRLFAAAAECGLTPAGPITYLFQGSTGALDQEFSLDFTLPVSGDPTTAPPSGIDFFHTPAARVMSVIHKGSMKTIGESYMKLMRLAGKPGDVREIYHKWVEFDSPENETELQVEVE